MVIRSEESARGPGSKRIYSSLTVIIKLHLLPHRRSDGKASRFLHLGLDPACWCVPFAGSLVKKRHSW